ncbi:hexapeptide repeat-containing transferase [Oleidesulfovibrio alaskensis G20]|uniref:Hexapeptide repeat-containing transferase n=2 Tax=Oleidesulfovibrio alaskensis (strain ATCC BAA-1058 / DSM 17464 / G20) TaxID=207559 RepID=Q30V63_OLEA2|nr:transferase [Oleidesulfovibrio alaskensis]ABB40433.1 hexapeptide repeat-containing transferase [Oleidesulfovibrio alaskensis G20]
MTQLELLLERIIDRVNVNLRHQKFDVGDYVRRQTPHLHYSKFYAFYGLSADDPVHFHFKNSSLAGSYLLGRVNVLHSALYKSDIRGDELKRKGQHFVCDGKMIPLHDDEVITIKDSFLNKTLVHSNSHDPESPEEFTIRNTVAMPYANIHGSLTEGSFIGSFATVDLSTIHNSVVRYFSYVQTGELVGKCVEPGQIWIKSGDELEFHYSFDKAILDKYISQEAGSCPTGVLMEFVEVRQEDFEEVFASGHMASGAGSASGASVSGYAVIKGDTVIGENVLVSQRAYLDNAWMGKGSNAQENCYIINSRLERNCVTAHGGKIINAHLGDMIFTGFNSFLQGSESSPLKIGDGCVVMPHTIIDLEEPLEIPAGHLVWGYIRNKADLAAHSISFEEFAKVDGEVTMGRMTFRGKGGPFLDSFKKRIKRILSENGAFFDGSEGTGHAQKGKNFTFNIIQPYQDGDPRGMYPTILIQPNNGS